MYKCILLPLDGSATAEKALLHASVLAERFGAGVVLMSVLETSAEPPEMWRPAVRQAELAAKAAALQYLEGVAARLRERSVVVRVVVVDGRPHNAITRYAEEESVDLIVISARGHSGLSRWLMGTVADRVTRGAKVPVLLVREKNL